MDTPLVPVKSRSIRLSHPWALLATVLIVGGAPPASPGLTGCAAPPPRSPAVETNAALPAPSALASGAPPSAVTAPAAPVASAATSSSAAVQAAPVPPGGLEAPAVEPPSAPPHVWKGGEFQRALSQFGQWVKKNGGTLGAELDDVASGSALGSFSAHTPENPASNQKILTTAAVLRHFGAEFRFRTVLLGARTGDGVAKLVLRGSGDPSLGSDDLQALAKALSQSGVHHVGELLIDQSYFDAHYVPPAFEQQPQEWAAFARP